jgi:polar amino acid transport system ATP-binding protein
MLQIQNFTKLIKGQKIFDNLSLEINKGEIICIVGPSGCGKSTFLRSIVALENLDFGSVSIDGEIYEFPLVVDQKLDKIYPKITMVFQQLFLWPHLTVKQNMTLAVGQNLDLFHFEELVDLFGLVELLNKYPNEISGGQRQRVALVRALLLKPQYLLLDEITSALDRANSDLVADYLNKLKSKGVGILVVTHDLEFAKRIRGRIFKLENSVFKN